MSTRFDRRTLYEEVWSTPRIHLRAKYGLTDYEFRKLCKAMRIPLPRAGHWSRVAAGHPIVRVPLPPMPDPSGEQLMGAAVEAGSG